MIHQFHPWDSKKTKTLIQEDICTLSVHCGMKHLEWPRYGSNPNSGNQQTKR